LEIDSAGERGSAVREMFSAIAPRYDLLNHLLSLNIDRSWRRRAVDRLGWESRPDGLYLDTCAGTFDLALELARRPAFNGHIIAVDFSKPMLQHGAHKIDRQPIAAACGDALKTPLASEAFDGAMVAFGVRNLTDINSGLHELRRVLRPGARLVILDFAIPRGRIFTSLYRFYFSRLLPLVGRLISKHSFAYNYLPESVEAFTRPEELEGLLREAGYGSVGHLPMTGGTVCVWWGDVVAESNQ
jgi:demethylmenaquinone methyltransferase/2-methoxy-6-polyprenyl-1,4-benzoquinol methylase